MLQGKPDRLWVISAICLCAVQTGCAAASVAGAAVTVAATAVGTTAKVAGTAVGVGADVVGAAGKAVTGGDRKN